MKQLNQKRKSSARARTAPRAPSGKTANRDLFRRFLDLWTSRHPPRLRDVVDPRVVNHASPAGANGFKALEKELAEFRTAFPDARYALGVTVVDADRVTGHATFEATQSGPFGSLPASGRPVKVNTIDSVKVKDGRIVELWPMRDRMALMSDLGVVAPLNATGGLGDILSGFRRAATLRTAIELGVFAAVGDGAGADALARRIQCPERSTRFLLDTLVEMGLLRHRQGTYLLGPTARQHLLPGGNRYIGGMASIWCSPYHWQGFAELTEAVRTDGTRLPQHAETPKHPFWETFARAQDPGAIAMASLLEFRMREWLASRPKLRLLDLGAGNGTFGFVLLQKLPSAALTLLEWPNVIPELRGAAERFGVADRDVRYIGGDLFEVDYQGPHDLVIAGHLLHHFDRDRCATAVRRIAESLAPGGRVILHEFLTFDGSFRGRSFNLTMLAWTRKGEGYPLREYQGWFSAAGLRFVDVLPNPGTATRLIVAEKPA